MNRSYKQISEDRWPKITQTKLAGVESEEYETTLAEQDGLEVTL
jgi:hypothetical protein